ncbi:uncharacterized protein LOC132395525 isoform X4 [Hypanus sabinus]|uniref:uncharacterized protein LOC132395525 isoform X4 n=1 Tax=Hypanus sabinus TaxID=79690 RepID=UPI0028C4FDD5|nr:uncharacterized protein LOC132395525 isoform X4 [Hypanus sabinus]
MPSQTSQPNVVVAAAPLPDELNRFYARFDVANSEAPRKATATTCNLVISEAEVRRCFQRVDSRKAAGPDGIPGRLLRMCTAQLTIFQMQPTVSPLKG